MDKSTSICKRLQNFSIIYGSSRQKISEDIKDLNNIINQLEPIDIYKTFHPMTAHKMLFFHAHGIFNNIDDILSQKKP